MKTSGFLWVLLLLMSLPLAGIAQSSQSLKKMKPPKEYDNIHVEKLNSHPQSSSFLIWVKEKVRMHKHAEHTEHVYVLKGKGEMKIGNEVREVKKGDVIFIPKGTPHGVKVTGGTLKVLSVQSPEFKGKDRIFLDN